jgi:hypothetical protein
MQPLLCLIALCGLDLDVTGGIAYANKPAAGTWWQPPYPAIFHLGPSHVWGAGVGGEFPRLLGIRSRWSVEYADLGVQSSAAVACAAVDGSVCPSPHPLSHWYGEQHPHGVWAAWEPTLWGPLFAKIGGGYFNDRFTMRVPDFVYQDAQGAYHQISAEAGSNVAWHPGYIAGLGVRWRFLDAIVSNRYIHTPNLNNGSGAFVRANVFRFDGGFENLSHSAWTFTLRARL